MNKNLFKCIKSLKEIGRTCKITGAEEGYTGRFYCIYHSSGKGGGVHIPVDFVNEYFGTGRPVKVQFRRSKEEIPGCAPRHLYICVEQETVGNRSILYGEWFEHEFTLDDDLFEI